jgi:8-oxo-dGTP pyrophosphatase MutT (NUDIX family)/phosphohistidine phosphatase SixA
VAPLADPRLILAAGAVVWRQAGDSQLEIALVHRPKYDDWSLPKGKLAAGEHVLVAAVREVKEETGYTVRLARPLPTQRYPFGDRPKEVRYWAAKKLGGAFAPNHEVDRLVWLAPPAAAELLTHPRDVQLIDALTIEPVDTATLILLRHAAAVEREAWTGDDDDRPLSSEGEAQAQTLRCLLRAYGPSVVVSSSARRCVDTVRPYVLAERCRLEIVPLLSETRFSTAPEMAIGRVAGLVEDGTAALVCTHRPVLPPLMTSLGIEPPSPRLAPGEFLVMHAAQGKVLAVERHAP